MKSNERTIDGKSLASGNAHEEKQQSSIEPMVDVSKEHEMMKAITFKKVWLSEGEIESMLKRIFKE